MSPTSDSNHVNGQVGVPVTTRLLHVHLILPRFASLRAPPEYPLLTYTPYIITHTLYIPYTSDLPHTPDLPCTPATGFQCDCTYQPVFKDAIDQRCCPLVGDRGVDINFVLNGVHLFCTRVLHGKTDIYATHSQCSSQFSWPNVCDLET